MDVGRNEHCGFYALYPPLSTWANLLQAQLLNQPPKISGRVLIFPVSGMGTLQAVEDPDPSYVIFVFQAPPPPHQPQVRPGNELKRDTPFFFFLTFMAQE